MTATVEVSHIPAEFCPATQRIMVNGWPVNHPEVMVTVCAWCDPTRILAKAISVAGYQVSHSVCTTCRDKFFGV